MVLLQRNGQKRVWFRRGSTWFLQLGTCTGGGFVSVKPSWVAWFLRGSTWFLQLGTRAGGGFVSAKRSRVAWFPRGSAWFLELSSSAGRVHFGTIWWPIWHHLGTRWGILGLEKLFGGMAARPGKLLLNRENAWPGVFPI